MHSIGSILFIVHKNRKKCAVPYDVIIKLFVLLLYSYQYVVWTDKSAVRGFVNSVWGGDNLSWEQFVIYT
jgi:hypothetical protein